MSKSLGNIITLNTLAEKNISPLAYRLWLLSGHYQTTMNFTWESVAGSQEAYVRLSRFVMDLKNDTQSKSLLSKLAGFLTKPNINPDYQTRFRTALENNLGTPEAVALLWEVVGDQKLSPEAKLATILDFDQVLGLGLKEPKNEPIPAHIASALAERETARQSQNWAKSDELRTLITSAGYDLLDTPQGQKIYKK